MDVIKEEEKSNKTEIIENNLTFGVITEEQKELFNKFLQKMSPTTVDMTKK